MRTYARSDRVAGQIQQVLANMLRTAIRDPRLLRTTITGVKMTPDLRIARVYFTTTGGRDRADQAAGGFVSALGFIKRRMAQELTLRYMPELEFFYDESLDYGERIDQLLETIKSDHDTDHSSS